jgi:AcrR family transcriptional regulator
MNPSQLDQPGPSYGNSAARLLGRSDDHVLPFGMTDSIHFQGKLASGKPGRPRSNRSHEAILDAAAGMLRRNGLNGLTIDGVVAEAKVSKGTVYRWWASKHSLAMDAILRIFNAELQQPDTGDVLSDFRIIMRQFRSLLSQGDLGYTFVALMIEAQQNQWIAEFHERFFRHRRKVLYIIIDRGIARDELRSDLDADLIVDLLFSPLIFRLLSGLSPIDDEAIENIIAAAAKGIAKTEILPDVSQ